MDQAKGITALRLAGEGDAIANDVAEGEFERFVEAMDLDVDEARMDAADAKSFQEAKRLLLREIRRGGLIVDDKGQPVYTLKSTGQTVTFYEPTGATFMAMDAKRKDHDIAKTFSLLADMTRVPEKTFANMPQRDLKICRTLMTLFLG